MSRYQPSVLHGVMTGKHNYEVGSYNGAWCAVVTGADWFILSRTVAPRCSGLRKVLVASLQLQEQCLLDERWFIKSSRVFGLSMPGDVMALFEFPQWILITYK